MHTHNTVSQAAGPDGAVRPVDTPEQPDRRQLLAIAAGTALAGALACLGCGHRDATGAGFGAPPSTTPAQPATSAPPLQLGKVEDFADGAPPKAVQIATADAPAAKATYIVDNLGGGAFRVLSPICTHKGCTVAWKPDQSLFVCPCHGGQFDRTGKNVGGPPPRPLAVLPARVEGGYVVI